MEREMPVTILLDGIFGRPRRWKGLKRKVEQAVGPAYIWEYSNNGRVGLDAIAERLSRFLTDLNRPFHFVAYSMGGLVARETMRQKPALPLRRSVFLHVPHGGSLMAHCLPLKAGRQMRPGSAFLMELDSAPWSFPTLATWCPADLMVFPGRSARWSKATHIYRSDVPAHAWPVYSRGIHRRILQFLREG